MITWEGTPQVEKSQAQEGGWFTRNLERARNVLANQVHPLRSPYSPLARLGQRRAEAYYHRTLDDRRLAEAWQSRYLQGLRLPENPVFLDHGCGRGRLIAFASNLGFTVAGQDIAAPPWWSRLPAACLQAVPPEYERLPWADAQFDVACDFQVLGHLPPPTLERLFREMFRVLRAGGTWVIQEANSRGFASRVTRRYYGRLYTLEEITRLAATSGFEVMGLWYEGFQAPVMPVTINYVRQVLLPREFDLDDSASKLAAIVPPQQRRLWVLRLFKPKS